MSKRGDGFESVSIPKYLIDEIDDLLNQNLEGMRAHTKAGFIQEAIRRHIDYSKDRQSELLSRKDHESVVDK